MPALVILENDQCRRSVVICDNARKQLYDYYCVKMRQLWSVGKDLRFLWIGNPWNKEFTHATENKTNLYF